MENNKEQEDNGENHSTDLEDRYDFEGIDDISGIQRALAYLISVRILTFDLEFISLANLHSDVM